MILCRRTDPYFTLHRLFVGLKSLKQSEHMNPLLSALGKGVPAQDQKQRWEVSARAIRKSRETSSIQKITAEVPQETSDLNKAAVPQKTSDLKKARGPGSAPHASINKI